MADKRPNYKREAPQCFSCIYVIESYNPGCQVMDYYCNIDPKHPCPIDEYGICDNYNGGIDEKKT